MDQEQGFNLEQLFQKLRSDFPDLRSSVYAPLAAAPYIVVQDGPFSAVLIRTTDQGLAIKAGLPPNGIAMAFGALGMLIQQNRRKALEASLRAWAEKELG
jgi:hypothetical protein